MFNEFPLTGLQIEWSCTDFGLKVQLHTNLVFVIIPCWS